jgi:hypothetical protein
MKPQLGFGRQRALRPRRTLASFHRAGALQAVASAAAGER